jgi:hypothetical protein
VPGSVSAAAAFGVAEGCCGDRWLFARAQRVIGAPKGGISVGGPALIVGLLVLWFFGVAAPNQGLFRTKESAYVAMMKSDLRNLAYAESQYFAERGAYVANLADLVRSKTDSSEQAPLFQTSAGVSVTVALLSVTGWYATARHNGTGRICEIWVGTAPPHLRGTAEGEPSCRRP